MKDFNIDSHSYNHIHFIGIGGISMSGLAKILLSYGYTVSGSDSKASNITNNLKELGATIYNTQVDANLEGADLVVYTDAISLDNEELKGAIKRKIDIVDRATFLGCLMKNYKKSIAVSGTHGKTTTTSMIAEIIKDLDIDPTILLGGELDDIHGNAKIGKTDLFLTEACEYKANVLKYFPTTAIILNIDEDHLDFFDNIEHIVDTFRGYVKNLGPEDNLILNEDDEYAKEMEMVNHCHLTTFGIKNDADFMAKNIHFDQFGHPVYDIYIKGEKKGEVELSIMGEHNVYNSLAAIAATYVNGIDINEIISNIKGYTGVHRRLEKVGEINGAIVMDDYAHHPTEIKSSLKALRAATKGKLYCVFQPHTFTRTKILLEGFSKSFSLADVVIITDIYAAREKDYGDIHSKTLVQAIAERDTMAFYMERFEDIVRFLENNLRKDDAVVTMGAGDVYKIGRMLIK